MRDRKRSNLLAGLIDEFKRFMVRQRQYLEDLKARFDSVESMLKTIMFFTGAAALELLGILSKLLFGLPHA